MSGIFTFSTFNRRKLLQPKQLQALLAISRIDPYLIWAVLVSGVLDVDDEETDKLKPRFSAVVETKSASTPNDHWFVPYVMPGRAPALRVRPVLMSVQDIIKVLSDPEAAGVERFELALARGVLEDDEKDGSPLAPIQFDPHGPTTISQSSVNDALKARTDIARTLANVRMALGTLSRSYTKATRPLICVVDDGCNFASASLVKARVSRIASIWHQDSDLVVNSRLKKAGWTTSLEVVEGTDEQGRFEWDLCGSFTGRSIRVHERRGGFKPQPPSNAPPAASAASAGLGVGLDMPEPQIYGDAAYPERLHRWSHGSGVLGLIAADRPWGVGPDDRKGHVAWPDAPSQICFVQLPDSTVLDTSGGSLANHGLDAIRHAVSVARPGQHVIVNLSYGTHSGGRDGTSIWDEGLRELLNKFDGGRGAQGKTLHVVLPAGNSHLWRCHAQKCLNARDSEMNLRWLVPPDNPSQSFLEIWLPPETEVKIEVRAPDGEIHAVHSRDFTPNDVTLLRQGGGSPPAWALIWPSSVPQSKTGTMALLAVAPTARWSDRQGWGNGITRKAFREAVKAAPHGIWTVKVVNVGEPTGQAVHAWVQRGDSAPGRPARPGRTYPGRQSRLLETEIESCDDPVGPGFTLNGLASVKHSRLYVVGAMRRSDATLSTYSAAGPNRIDPSRFDGPDRVVVADESPNVFGVLTQGFLGGGRIRLSGTSLAAAAFTRMLYEDLQARAGTGPLHAWPVGQPSREARVSAGSPRHAAVFHRGEETRLFPDHPYGRLKHWPPKRG